MRTKVDLAKYLHLCAWSPVVNTWLKAIDRSFFLTWPRLSSQLIKKHLPKSIATAKISSSDLEENEKRMKAAYDPNLPIKFLLKQIEDAVVYADHGQDPVTPTQVANRAINLVIDTGLFTHDCKEWKYLTPAQKTWPAFKVKFVLAHQEYRESQATQVGSHFGRANKLVDQ